MLLMTLKGIKKMLDKALDRDAKYNSEEAWSPRLTHVENAGDLLEELIKECEKGEVKEIPPSPPGERPSELSPQAEKDKSEILG